MNKTEIQKRHDEMDLCLQNDPVAVAKPIGRRRIKVIHKDRDWLLKRVAELEEYARIAHLRAEAEFNQRRKFEKSSLALQTKLDAVKEIPDFVEQQSEEAEPGDDPTGEYVVYLIRKAIND